VRCVVRPAEPFSARERDILRRWSTGISARMADSPSALEIRSETLLVNAGADMANDVALAAMVVLGRPFLYEILTVGAPNGAHNPARFNRALAPGRLGDPTPQPAVE
jgi:hypothetical protein